ncbi:hypothetical protein GGE67_002486 [Rhizobium leucaenae]|uniref:Uncharacterized protein n=1 Tax=Rhizobium leucaenae TaxID=29450 RepID=A0A7W6ZRT0_9HYPH|nr:hypothetical protein [Rhizobium leucaenae]MBB6301871.1 hypothetical protein [Rhizobium leucaenae]
MTGAVQIDFLVAKGESLATLAESFDAHAENAGIEIAALFDAYNREHQMIEMVNADHDGLRP